MNKAFNLLAVLLTVLVLSASSAYAGNKNGNSSHGWHNHGHNSHSWSSWFSGWGPGNGWGWGHFKSRNDKGGNGCERSNSRSSACDNPDPAVIFCSPWTDFEVQHPISWEIAANSSGWMVGDVAVFASGATCEVNQVSIGGRNDTPTPPPGRG